MKKLLIPFLGLLLLTACSKEKESAPQPFMRAKIDGVTRDFSISIVAQKSNEGKTVTIVAASGSMASAFPALSLDIEDDAALTARTYKAADAEVVFGYLSNAVNTYFSANDFTVTITSVTSTDVTGTFSGNISNGSSNVKVEEGSFFAIFE